MVEAGRIQGGTTIDVESSVSGVDLVLRRTGAIAGRVTRPDGTPVAKTRVLSQIRLTSLGLVATGPGALTDLEGRYQLDDVPPGTYVITANYSRSHEMIGTVPDEYQDWALTFHPATTEFDRATPVTMRGGERVDRIDIILQPQIRYRVRGIVVAEDGSTSVRGARVDYATEAGTWGYANTTEEGRFTIGAVSGAVTVRAVAETDKDTLAGTTTLNITRSDGEVRVALGAPAQVRGRIIFEGAPPPSDPPLEVEFMTEAFRIPHRATPPAIVRVGSDGRFSIENLIGEYRVHVRRLMPQWQVKVVRRAHDALPDGRLQLATGQIVDDLEIIIARTP